jgi:uncharacterized protein (DUF2267 family)
MSDTGYASLSSSVEKTNQTLKEIEAEYGWSKEERQRSYDALRAVLHALRDRLTVSEAADLAAQLPMVMRGLYYEGWRPAGVPITMSEHEFIERVQRELPFQPDGGTELLVQRVFHALARFVTEGEWDDIRATLPKEFAHLIPV